MAPIAGTGQIADTETPADFVSDGCSLFPDGNYRDCCVAHDKAYYLGGSRKDRRAADKELYSCVISKGNSKFLASMIFVGVRVGGFSFLPTSFRWGFGRNFRKKREPQTTEKLPATH